MTMPIDQQNAIRLAVLESEFTHIKNAMVDLKFTNARQTEKIDELLKTLHEAKGGWRTLMMVGGAAGSLGGLIAWIISQWKG